LTKDAEMKILVVGYGSIGKRHAENLAAMGAGEIFVAEPNDDLRSAASSEVADGVFKELDEALEKPGGYDVGLIATPTHLHAGQAMLLLDHCRALFVEKPLSDKLDGLDALCNKARRLGAPTMVGCNMRFYPTLRRMHELTAQSHIGDPLYARARFGYYLPLWRPNRDYRELYSAKADQGGGIVLDDIHEIDLAWHFMGPFKEFQVLGGKLSSLEIDVEDFASISLKNSAGAVVSIVMDYIHPLYQREFEIVGAKGAMRWREETNILEACRYGDKDWQEILKLDDFDYNEIYEAEIAYFLDCIKNAKAPMNSFDEAFSVLSLAVGIRNVVRKQMNRRPNA